MIPRSVGRSVGAHTQQTDRPTGHAYVNSFLSFKVKKERTIWQQWPAGKTLEKEESINVSVSSTWWLRHRRFYVCQCNNSPTKEKKVLVKAASAVRSADWMSVIKIELCIYSTVIEGGWGYLTLTAWRNRNHRAKSVCVCVLHASLVRYAMTSFFFFFSPRFVSFQFSATHIVSLCNWLRHVPLPLHSSSSSLLLFEHSR